MLKSKASLQSQSQLHKVSTRLCLVLLESRFDSGSFFSENKSLGSASITKSLSSVSKSTILFTPLVLH